MNIEEYVIAVVAAGVFICTEVIKRVAFRDEELRDRYVPLVAVVLGVIFNAWYNGFANFDYITFLNGLASGFAAIGIFAGIKSVASSFQAKGE